jgi:hypothetical protein
MYEHRLPQPTVPCVREDVVTMAEGGRTLSTASSASATSPAVVNWLA